MENREPGTGNGDPANGDGPPCEFWIDVGGTFTDCLGRGADGWITSHKLLSTGVYKGRVGDGSSRSVIVDPLRRGDPDGFFVGWQVWVGEGKREWDVTVAGFDAAVGALRLQREFDFEPRVGDAYELRCDVEAPVVGMRWLLGKRLDEALGPVRVRLGTTRGTNALLEHNGARTALVTTAGSGDVLRIGVQARPRLFDLNIRKPRELYEAVVEVDERVDARGVVLRGLDEKRVREELAALRAAGIESLAVCLLNSYRNADHEERIARIAEELGFAHVSVSSRLSALQRIVPRGETAVVDAYLGPVIRDYVASIRAAMPAGALKLMTSAGGLADASAFVAKDSILSGPAAGVVGFARVAEAAGFQRAIGFDMGGTSTDASRYDGEFERRYEMEVEDRETGGAVRIVAPMLAIETVAAGGGSICDFDGIKPIVGPRSAGADPGPACYGRGGPLCLTDVNVFLGRVPADLFPFPLDREAVAERLDALITRIEAATERHYAREELAGGFISIANAHMAAAIRKVSIQRGCDPRDYALVSFGGAGGQHACAIARELGIRTILSHPYAGVLSAYGIGLADVTKFAARDVGRTLDSATSRAVESMFEEMEASLREELLGEEISAERIAPPRRLLDLRYQGQDAAITVARPIDGDWEREFERLHRQLYGFAFSGRGVQIAAARVELAAQTPRDEIVVSEAVARTPTAKRMENVFFDGREVKTPIYVRAELEPGDRFDGPAIVVERTGTIVIEAGWCAEVTSRGDVVLRQVEGETNRETEPGARAMGSGPALALGVRTDATAAECDPVTLELFNNHFAGIAEQMGATLQRTALSTNVKERLDFSCAIYDAEGGLVANAPHIPVHLGAMGECVKGILRDRDADEGGNGTLRPGEVWVTNDPYSGGSHLPDVTVVTPVFDDTGREVLFFSASRAHHAEIGGVAPGSMPPRSASLAEEGVLIRPMRLVMDEGAGEGRLTIRDDELRRLLSSGRYPSRSVEQNLADIQAQAAANRCGARLLREMVGRFGLETVRAYMGHIQRAAEAKMRAALREQPDGEHVFTDYLDDGSPLVATVTVRGDEAVVDFTGTGPVLAGNLNATPAIVASAVLYCFRCLIADDIPLNAGVLKPIRIVLPECFLNPPAHDDPARCAAVAGGNVETSQRIVDAVFGALGVVAASQGTMNNVAFGNKRFGYYETIGGGAGAGPDFDGASAVQVHMTNTRLTDPEVLEDRYPVRLRRFAIRRGSGGDGKHRGGDGIVREIEFLQPLELSLLTQRRTRPPFGLAGGHPGKPGRNKFVRADGASADLGSLAQVRVSAGDVLLIETPGGGGFGLPTT